MARTKANGINIEYQEFGDPSHPAIILIAGWSAQLTLWPDEFLQSLADAGLRVIVFDNRDVGLSEKMLGSFAPHPMFIFPAIRMLGMSWIAPYKLEDMAEDVVGLMDALHIKSAHILGLSLGGMIGQIVAGAHQHRVRSFTAMMSSTNNHSLPLASEEVIRSVILAPRFAFSHNRAVENSVKRWTIIGTPGGGQDTVEFREWVEATVNRSFYPFGAWRQLAAAMASGDIRHYTRQITAPSLIVHGDQDPILPHQCGLDIARNIPGARAEIIQGWGHDLSPKMLPQVTRLITEFLADVERRATSSQAA